MAPYRSVYFDPFANTFRYSTGYLNTPSYYYYYGGYPYAAYYGGYPSYWYDGGYPF
jgi:hypothetical protein